LSIGSARLLDKLHPEIDGKKLGEMKRVPAQAGPAMCESAATGTGQSGCPGPSTPARGFLKSLMERHNSLGIWHARH
jgi:hypothetical protein